MKPSIGRVVHLLTAGTHECQTAFVTRVNDDGTSVALAVFPPPRGLYSFPEEQQVIAPGDVPQDEKRSAGATWHWPERSDG